MSKAKHTLIYPGNIWSKRLSNLACLTMFIPNLFLGELQSEILEFAMSLLQQAEYFSDPLFEGADQAGLSLIEKLDIIRQSRYGWMLDFADVPSAAVIKKHLTKLGDIHIRLRRCGEVLQCMATIINIATLFIWVQIAWASIWVALDVWLGKSKIWMLTAIFLIVIVNGCLYAFFSGYASFDFDWSASADLMLLGGVPFKPPSDIKANDKPKKFEIIGTVPVIWLIIYVLGLAVAFFKYYARYESLTAFLTSFIIYGFALTAITIFANLLYNYIADYIKKYKARMRHAAWLETPIGKNETMRQQFQAKVKEVNTENVKLAAHIEDQLKFIDETEQFLDSKDLETSAKEMYENRIKTLYDQVDSFMRQKNIGELILDRLNQKLNQLDLDKRFIKYKGGTIDFDEKFEENRNLINDANRFLNYNIVEDNSDLSEVDEYHEIKLEDLEEVINNGDHLDLNNPPEDRKGELEQLFADSNTDDNEPYNSGPSIWHSTIF